MASNALQMPPRVAQASRLGQKHYMRHKKYVLTMAIYACDRHIMWCTQAAWTQKEYVYNGQLRKSNQASEREDLNKIG